MVQVYHGHSWGWICAEGWDKKAADVVCHELGLYASSAFYVDMTTTDDDKETWWLNNVRCVGNEPSIFSCSHKGLKKRQSCGSNKKASVVCTGTEGTTALSKSYYCKTYRYS